MIAGMYDEIERKTKLVGRIAKENLPSLKQLIRAHDLLADIVFECRELDRLLQERYLDLESGQKDPQNEEN